MTERRRSSAPADPLEEISSRIAELEEQLQGGGRPVLERKLVWLAAGTVVALATFALESLIDRPSVDVVPVPAPSSSTPQSGPPAAAEGCG